MEDKLQLFYNSLTANPNIKGLPSDYELFRTTLTDPAKSELFYNSLRANPNIKGLPDNYSDFVSGLALNTGGLGEKPESPEVQQQHRAGIFENSIKRFSATIYDMAKGVTELPQWQEGTQNTYVQGLAKAIINRQVKKGKIDRNEAEYWKNNMDSWLPKMGFIYPVQPGKEMLGEKIADSGVNQWLGKTAEQLRAEANRYDKSVTEYLKNKEWGKAFGAEITAIIESAPYTIAAAFGGPMGATGLGAIVGAQKYDEIKDRDDMSDAMKLIDSTSTAFWEALFEYIGTKQVVDLLKRRYSDVAKDKVEDEIKKGIIGFLSKAYKKLGVWFASVHEGTSEFATQVAQNLTARFTGEDPNRNPWDGAADSFLVGIGMGTASAAIEQGMEQIPRYYQRKQSQKTPIDQGPAAIGELKVPYTQEQAAEIINNIGRDLKFGDTPLEEDTNPMISFAQTMIGQKVILKKEGGIKGDDFFIAFDLETNEPVLVKAKDIKERKDVPYQEWFNNELQNYNIVKSQADNMAAQMEAPVQPGQEITLRDKNFYVSEVTPEGIVLNEIDEEGNVTGATLQITPDQYNTVFGTDEGIQETENLPENELPSATGEGIQAAPEAPGARTLTVGKTNYSVVPDETGILTIDQVFTDEATAKNAIKALEKGYPKASFSLNKTEFEDFLTPDEYRITVQPKKAKVEPAKPESKAEKPAEPEKVEPAKVVGKNDKGEEIRVGDEIGYQWRDGFMTKPGKVIGVEHDASSNVTWVKTDGPEGENKLNISVAQVVKPEEPAEEQPVVEQTTAQAPSTPDETAPEEVKQKAGEVEKPSERFAPVDKVLEMTGQNIVNEWEEHAYPIDQRVIEDDKKIAELTKQKRAIRKKDEKAKIDQQIKDIRQKTAQLYNDLENEFFERNESIKQWGIAEAKKKGIEIDTDDENDDEFFGELMTDIFERPGREHTWTMKFKDVFDENFKYWVDNEMFTQLKEQKASADLAKANTEVDTKPTEAQKKAGNYKKGHISIQGLEISIENPAGSIRSGVDKSGKEWSVKLNNSYGYFRRTKGKDGDQIDVFLGDNLNSESVYVIDQVDPKTGLFDEHKVMMGFDSAESARENYLANYEPVWKGLGSISKMSIDQFKEWLGDGTRTRKPVDNNIPVKKAEKPQKPVKEVTLKPKRGFTWGPNSRTGKVLAQTPNSFREAVLQFFVAGNRIKTQDFLDHTGYKRGSREFKQYIWAIKNDGVRLDVFNEALENSFGIEDKGPMDMINEVIDILRTYPGRGKMISALEDLQSVDKVPDHMLPPEADDEFIDDDIEGMDEEVDDVVDDDIMQHPEVKSIVLEYSSDDILDVDKLLSNIESNPDEFTIFPFALKKSELIRLKERLQNEQRRRAQESQTRADQYNQDQGKGTGENTPGSTQRDRIRTGREEGPKESTGPAGEQINKPEFAGDVLKQESGKSTAKEYKYKMTLRPFDIGTYPKDGFVKADNDPSGGYQILTYSRKLTAQERNHYSFIPLTEIEELKDKQFADKDGEFFVDLEWMGNNSGADVSMFDNKNQLVEKPFFMSTNDILKNIESGYWTEKKFEKPQQPTSTKYNIKNFDKVFPEDTREIAQLIEKLKEAKQVLGGFQSMTEGETDVDALLYAEQLIEKKEAEIKDIESQILKARENQKKIIRKGPHTYTKEKNPYLSDEEIKILNEFVRQEGNHTRAEIDPIFEKIRKGQAEQNKPKVPERKGPDINTIQGQIAILKRLVDTETQISKIDEEIKILNKPSLDPKSQQALKKIKQLGLTKEQLLKSLESLKIENPLYTPEQGNEIKKLIRENLAQNEVVSKRILRLQDERDAKEKQLQKRSGVFGDTKKSEPGMQELFAGDKLFQPTAENLQAALKPFNDAIKKAEEEWKRNDQLLDEKIDLLLKGTQAKMDFDTPPAEPDEKAETPKKETPDPLKLEIVEVSKPAQKIEDFGEHISGAKKEIRGQLRKQLDTTNDDLLNNSISKVLPIIDYKQLVDSGTATPQEAAFLAWLRLGIGTKPKSTFKQKAWLRSVNAYKDALGWIIEPEKFKAANNGLSLIQMIEKSADEYMVGRMKDYINTLVELGFPTDVTSLKGYEIKYFSSERRRGKSGEQLPATHAIIKGHYIIKEFATREEAIAGLKYILTTENEASQKVKFDIWQKRGEKGLYIGKKLGPNKFITLASGFDKVSEVRKYIENHQEELERMLDEKKVIPYERPETRGPRIGKDYRKGENITPDKFSDTFGFRGVQFGNYVEQLKRQEDLNEAYDALMDLSEVLNLPPKALSLTGQLGIAFGARGSGGKQAPSAHYEPDQIVINLTKTAGAGSLAHEWFHAVDNYFSRMRGGKFGYITERPRQLINKEGTKDLSVRPEVLEAFNEVVRSINKSGLYDRSKELDKRRSKDYWSQTIEMGARSFESYVRAKLAEKETKNDYLVSFKDLVDYILAAGGANEVYPYPTNEEAESINQAFDQLFNTIKVKTDENYVSLLYEKAEEYIKKNEVYSQARPKTDFPEGVSFVSERSGGNVPGQLSLFGKEVYSPTAPDDNVTYSERLLSDKGQLEFLGEKLTGPAEIKSSQDVAFLFKNLESAASEHVFCVLIDKDNKYKVLYVSTGSTGASIVDAKIIVAASKEFNAERAVFVHNHPSGTLNPSEADRSISRKVQDALELVGVTLDPSVIIDLDSGQYAVFDNTYDFIEESVPADQYTEVNKVVPQNVYQFDRQKLYIPSIETTKIKRSSDVAEYLSKMKRGTTPKLHAIILDRGNRIRRYVLFDETISKDDLIKELLYEVGKHGECVILASNNEPAPALLLGVTNALKSISAQVLDYIIIKQSEDIINNYKSYADEGFMEEPDIQYGGEVNDPGARFRISDNLYFSPVERALDAIKQEKATSEQWKAMLLKNGAKEAELAWMGWDELVDIPGGAKTYTKEELRDWINQNKVEIKEVGYGGEERDDKYDKLLNDLERAQRPIQLFEAVFGDYPFYHITSDKWVYRDEKGNVKDVPEVNMPDVLKWNEAKQAVDDYIDEHTNIYGDFEVAGATKYGQYTLPGGEDYRELLLTMPAKTERRSYSVSEIGKTGRYVIVDDATKRPITINGKDSWNKEDAERIALQRNNTYFLSGDEYTSPHWDQPNILAHVRFNTRRTKDGKNVLFIEEVQSDWAQEGKKKGFKIPKEEDIYQLARKIYYLKRNIGPYNIERTEAGLAVAKKEAEQKGITEKELSDAMEKYAPDFTLTPNSFGVSDMPYKKTDQWAGLALRRMIRYAIDNGFDAIAWTPGEVQNERYDLSKQVDEIWIQEAPKKPGMLSITGYKGDDSLINEDIEPSKLADYVGKELAEKYINSEKGKVVNNLIVFKGNDLKVGGSGMIGFYDNILPSIANKLGKKFGAKVEPLVVVGNENSELAKRFKYLNDRMAEIISKREVLIRDFPSYPEEEQKRRAEEYNSFNDEYNALNQERNDMERRVSPNVLYQQDYSNAVHSLPITDAMFESYREGVPLFKGMRSLSGESLLFDVVGVSGRETWENDLREKVNELSEALNTKINVIRSRSELPVRIQRQALRQGFTQNKRITGVYDPQSDSVYVVLDDIRTAGTARGIEEVTKTVLHEIVAHQGLPSLLGLEEYNKLLDQLFWDMPQIDRSFLMDQYKTTNPRTIAEEYLGMMAEDNVNPSLFQRILAKIRQLARKLFKVRYSANDINDMLRRSRENLQKPQAENYGTAEEYLEALGSYRDARFRITQAYKKTVLEQAAEAYTREENKRKIQETLQGIREYIQDLNLPVRKFEEEVLKRGGKQDNGSKPYRDTSLSFGRHEKLYTDFYDQKMVPVIEAVSNIKKAGIPGEEILPYIISKHAIERNRVFREKELREFVENNPEASQEEISDFEMSIRNKDYSGVMPFDKEGKYTSPDELAKDIVKEFESKVDKGLIDDLWSKLRDANTSILDTWEAGVQISPDQKKEYMDQFKYFVPLRGWKDGAAKELAYTKGNGFSHSLRHAEGRKSLADNPLAYILNVEFQAISEQVTNEVNNSMLNLIIRNLGNNEIHELATIKKLYYLKVNLPDGSYEWEPTLTRPTPEQFANGEVRTKIFREHERLRAPSQAREHEVIVHKPGGDMIMIFKGKNLTVAQALNKQNYLYRSIFGNIRDARDMNKAMAFLGDLNNMLKAAYTSWNVVFPFTNFMRDFQEASITQAIKQGSGLKVIRNYKHAFPAIARHIVGKPDLHNSIDRQLDEFYKLGGATGYTHLKTPEEIEKDINKEIKRMVRAGTLRGDMANTAHKFLTGVEYWNQIFEDATRFSVYMASLAAGNTKQDAAYDAKEASVNFNRKGKGSKAWDSWFAFFNVALQSMQKNFALAKNYTGKFSAVALSFVTVGFLEAMMNALFDDDEETSYYNINPYMRQNYLVIPNITALLKGESKGDKYLSIPLPQFWRGFKSMGAIGFDIATKRMTVKDGVMHALGNFGSALLPVDIGGFWKSGEFSFAPIVPTVIKPIIEVAENRNYMGYAIKNEPFTRDQEKILARSGLGKNNVSPAAKFITDMLFRWGGGDSKYKYYYDSYKEKSRKVPGILDINPSTIEHLFKGYTGGTGAVFSDIMTTISQGLDTEQDIDYRNVPFVNRFIRKIPEAKWNVISEYYELRDDSKVTNLLSSNYFKEGQYEKAREITGDEYLMKYVEIFKHYESALDDAKKDTDFDEVEGNYRGIELMRQCISDIKDLKEQFGRK